MANNIIIYILCADNKKFITSQKIYKKYSWAKPILLKYKDFSFENTFWKQLNEIEYEWENCDMVGTISSSAFKKINLMELDEILKNKLYLPSQYYHFMDSHFPIPNFNTDKHPHFNDIWVDILYKLNLKSTTENCCNYWMCSPELMKAFVLWYTDSCLPALLQNPFILEDAKYTGEDWDNAVTSEKLTQVWGKPYYPHFPFVAERLNKCFFETFYPEHVEKINNFCWQFYTNNYDDLKQYNKVNAKQHYYKYGQFENRNCYGENHNMKTELIRYNNLSPKMVFLIGHDKSVGGAQNCLLNIKNLYEGCSIKTELLYLEDINFNVREYILNKSRDNNCVPVVFCNTLCCYEHIRTLSKTNILTYWYIHEWYDRFTEQFFKEYIHDTSVFNSSVNLIFVCNASFNNYSNYIPNITSERHIIYNNCSSENLDQRIKGNNKLIKQPDIIYLSIIGTVEKRKNQQEFINNVFYRLKDKYSNIKLLIVGEVRESLEISQPYVADVVIVGGVKNALPYINMSDILVSYSINEVSPLNIIEGFYCEKPVVSSNVGGISEMIIDGYNGYMFETNEHDRCFNILCNLLEDTNLRETLGRGAKETFFTKFDRTLAISKFLSMLTYN